MKYLIPLICSILIGCEGGSSGDAGSGGGSNPPPPAAEAVTITIKSGNGFECFSLDRTVYCRGVSANHDVNLNTPSFVAYVESSTSPILSLETWDDTICWTVYVDQRPYSRLPGNATYCVGEATLGGSIAAYPAVYSGPNYTTASNGSADLTYAEKPMMGGDFIMNTLLNSTFMSDGSSSVVESDVVCEKSADGMTLSCPSFSVSL